MADFFVIFQIFQKESNLGGGGVSVVLSYEQGSILPNLQI